MVLLEHPFLGVHKKGCFIQLMIDWALATFFTTYLRSQRLVSERVAFLTVAGDKSHRRPSCFSALISLGVPWSCVSLSSAF